MRKVLLIDGDSEVYAAAAAAERRRVVALMDATTLLGPFETVKDCTAALPKGAAATLSRSQEVMDAPGACLLLDARLRRVIYQAEERYGPMDVEVYLSGSVNYRHLLDHTYKANRGSVQKPHWLGKLRDHCQAEWGAKVTLAWEADDEVGIRAGELGDRAVICSVDKDLRQVPGNHIVLGKGHLHMTEAGALLRLYTQILAGDSTDNIRGCWQTGAEGAWSYLAEFVEAGPAAMWAAVVARYQESLDKYGSERCRYFDARGAALHTAQLVYILRNRPEGQIPPRWLPPGG